MPGASNKQDFYIKSRIIYWTLFSCYLTEPKGSIISNETFVSEQNFLSISIAKDKKNWPFAESDHSTYSLNKSVGFITLECLVHVYVYIHIYTCMDGLRTSRPNVSCLKTGKYKRLYNIQTVCHSIGAKIACCIDHWWYSTNQMKRWKLLFLESPLHSIRYAVDITTGQPIKYEIYLALN